MNEIIEIIENAEQAITEILPKVQISRRLDTLKYQVVVHYDDFYVCKYFTYEVVEQPKLLAKLMIPIIDDFFSQRIKTLAFEPGEVSRTTGSVGRPSE